MGITRPLIAELERESVATRKVLERIPEEMLDWRPHPTSMSLGQLALHVAAVPGAIADMVKLDETAPPDFGERPSPESPDEVLRVFESSLANALATLEAMDDDQATARWRVVRGGEELMAMPKVGFVRFVMLNHWYHHRGQLCVYLRMLGIPVPAVYGASADENLFERGGPAEDRGTT